jgi:hypothetical protein
MRNLSFYTQQLVRRSLSPLVLAGALCTGVLGTSHVAQAQEVEVEVVAQPPVARVEVIPPAPSPHHFWIHGYYGWNGTTHYWNSGRYEVVRPGYGWSEARWVSVGPRWHYYPGRWYVVR